MLSLQYATLLERMVEVFVCVEMWSVDPVMEAEACLKLALLYECQADLDAPASNASPGIPSPPCVCVLQLCLLFSVR